MWGSQEKNLGPKVNVKFFTVDPYTPCNKVSHPFPIWQIWPLLGQKNISRPEAKKYGYITYWPISWRIANC